MKFSLAWEAPVDYFGRETLAFPLLFRAMWPYGSLQPSRCSTGGHHVTGISELQGARGISGGCGKWEWLF
jgi:hypothetical protein